MAKCKKHMTSEGWYDEEGKWHCWKCTKENEYFYPKGRILDKMKVGSLEVRIIDTGEPRHLILEVWDTDNMKRIYKCSHPYLSSCKREFEEWLLKIEREYKRGNRHGEV